MADITLCPVPLPRRHNVKLPWGLDLNNKLVHVSAAQNGRACKLSCPQCGGALDAKQGTKLRWHLAHVSTTWCNGGLESIAHRRAIEIIASHKSVFLPPIDENCEGFWGTFSSAIDEVPLALGRMRRVDLMLYARNAKLAVEVCVHHAVDVAKEADLKLWPHPSIEIFINPGIALSASEDNFVSHVLKASPRRWISQAGWFAGTRDGEEKVILQANALEAEIFKARAQQIRELTPVRLSFLRGLAAIKVETPSGYAQVSLHLKSGKGDSANYHPFMVKCGEVGRLLGLSAHKVGYLVKKLGLPYSAPWGFTFLGERFVTNKISPQGVISLWNFASEQKLTTTSCPQLIDFLQQPH